MSVYASYGSWKYKPSQVRARADAIVEALPELRCMHDIQFDAVVLTGSSGTWLGGILQAHPAWPEELPVILCRKEGEASHGPMFEGELCGKTVRRLLLVDDFVASGNTVRRVHDSWRKHCEGDGVVAVLEHARLVDEYDAPGTPITPLTSRLRSIGSVGDAYDNRGSLRIPRFARRG